MKVLHKIKLFAWRACKDKLSCVLNLQKKKVQVDLLCVFYKASTEDLLHAMFLCPKIQQWWTFFPPLTQNMKQAGSLLELAMLGKDHGKANELDTFFVIASSLWRRRNKRIFADLEEEPRTTIEWTLSSHKLYSECLKIPTQELLNVSCWKPLDQGSLKLNIDGIIFADLQAAGIGAIL